MQDRFLHGRQIAFMIHVHFRVAGPRELFLIIQIYAVSFYRVVIVKILIPGGTKFYYLRKNYSKTVVWKVCTRCEYEGLCNSRRYWL